MFRIKQVKDLENTDIRKLMSIITLQIVLESIFGKSNASGSDENMIFEISDLVYKAANILQERAIKFVTHIPFVCNLPIVKKTELDDCVVMIHRLAQEVIDKRAEELKMGNPARETLLDSLLLNKDQEIPGVKLTSQTILDQAISFLLAGHETTSGKIFIIIFIMTFLVLLSYLIIFIIFISCCFLAGLF